MVLLAVFGMALGMCVGPDYVPELQEWEGPAYYKQQGRPDALYALDELFEELERLGLYPVVISGYRSYQKQELLHRLDPEWTEPAGCSQHQLGTAFDIAWQGLSINITAGPDDLRNNQLWYIIHEIGPDYGFYVTYDDEGLILPEPWHVNYEPIKEERPFPRTLCIL